MNKSIFLSDNPNEKKDSFQVHTNISETLFDIIEKHDVSKNSFTIGLFGEWGSGKSFIINKLEDKLKDNTSDVTFINIDVWKYSGMPLLRSILFEFSSQLETLHKLEILKDKTNRKYKDFSNGYRNPKSKSLKDILYYDEVFESVAKLTSKDFKEKLKTIVDRYKWAYIGISGIFILFLIYQFLPSEWFLNNFVKRSYDVLKTFAPIGSFVGVSGLLLLLFKKPFEKVVDLIFFRNTVKNFTEKANFSPEQFEGIFKEIISKIENEKYVIVFDNIDRCEPHIAYETLSTIKSFMDIKNCFYIIPADDEAIKKYLSSNNINRNDGENNIDSFERKFAEEFIDKIFQTYIRIPILKEVERDKYIQEQLNKIDFENKLSTKDINTITEILYFAYKGESPRNIIRFVNDYSTYFQLALKSLPVLLDNITLFTIMIAIKQKWHNFEKILMTNPTFFSLFLENQQKAKKLIELDQDNKTELLKFIKSLSTFYIPEIRNESILSYIYFKESEKSFEISELLKSNNPENFQLNTESIKILISEFKKNLSTEGIFLINSFLTIASLIQINSKKPTVINLIKEFWIGFISISSEQIKSILEKLSESNLLKETLDTLQSNELDYHINKIEPKMISYLSEPIEKNSEFENYVNIFKIILDSEYKFTPNKIKSLFKNWKKEEVYLNTLLEIINEKKKISYLPELVLNQLIDGSIDANSITLLNNWDNSNIPKQFGIKLFNLVSKRIKNVPINNHQQLTQQKTTVEENFKLILLLDTSFLTEQTKDDFFKSFATLINKIFQFANNQQPFFELGIKYWFELSYFANISNELIDSSMASIFNKYIKSNPIILNIFKEKLDYIEKLLSLNNTKLAIFNFSQEIQSKIYNKLDKKYFNDYKLLLPYPVEIKHIDELINYSANENIQMNKKPFSKFLLEQIIKEFVKEKIDLSNKLEYLNKTFDLNSHKQIIIDHKIAIVDFYKKNSTNSINFLKKIKSLLSYSDFFKNILNPILIHIKSKLSESENINEFTNLTEVIETTKNINSLKLYYKISKDCLEKNQDIKENYFGINVLGKIYSNLSNDQKIEIIDLIKNNDHYLQWDSSNKEILIEIGIIEKDVLPTKI